MIKSYLLVNNFDQRPQIVFVSVLYWYRAYIYPSSFIYLSKKKEKPPKSYPKTIKSNIYLFS